MNMKKQPSKKPSAPELVSHHTEGRDIVFAQSDVSCLRGIDQKLTSAVLENCNIKLKLRIQ